MNKLKMETEDLTLENIEKLKELFPSVVSDGKIDFDKLKQELSADIVKSADSYDFTWVGKHDAVRKANEPVNVVLRPCPEESKNWEKTKNVYIEGDNLDVLKILYKSYAGKIKMIYIDPPYNRGSDLIYKDNFAQNISEYNSAQHLSDEQGNQLERNTDTSGRYHSTWCSMMYPRLKLARKMLSDDGVIFISIDDHEVANLKKICDEVFGENNFVGILIHQRAKGGGQAKYIVKGHDYILVYGKVITNVNLARKKVIQQKIYEINGEICIKNTDVIRKVFGKYDRTLGDRRCFYEELIQYKGVDKKKEIDEQLSTGELFLEENPDGTHTICRYEKVADTSSKLYSIIKVLSEKGKKELDDLNIIGFSYPKPTELLQQLIESGCYDDKSSIILDFFSGSATTAHAVMQLNAEDGGNRKFIMVQLPEVCDEKSEAYKAGYQNICEIGKERIRRAGEKIISETGKADLDVGFRVFKLDSSNMKNVYFTPAELIQKEGADIEDLADNVKPDRNAADLLFGVMQYWNMTECLSAPHKTKEIDGFTIHIVQDGQYPELVACFDADVPETVITKMAKLNPLRAVFRERCFKTTQDRLNAERLLKNADIRLI